MTILILNTNFVSNKQSKTQTQRCSIPVQDSKILHFNNDKTAIHFLAFNTGTESKPCGNCVLTFKLQKLTANRVTKNKPEKWTGNPINIHRSRWTRGYERRWDSGCLLVYLYGQHTARHEETSHRMLRHRG